MRDFHDKVAFVTGGASGLGFALGRAFGRARMKVMLADIDVDSLENAVAELKKDQISVRGVECDVSDRTSVQRAAAETLAAFGKVHVVCNNAGPGVGGPLELTTPGDCDWIIGVDLMGTIYGCQTFLPHIKAHGEGGHIVSTASVSGLYPAAWCGRPQRRQSWHHSTFANPRCGTRGHLNRRERAAPWFYADPNSRQGTHRSQPPETFWTADRAFTAGRGPIGSPCSFRHGSERSRRKGDARH